MKFKQPKGKEKESNLFKIKNKKQNEKKFIKELSDYYKAGDKITPPLIDELARKYKITPIKATDITEDLGIEIEYGE